MDKESPEQLRNSPFFSRNYHQLNLTTSPISTDTASPLKLPYQPNEQKIQFLKENFDFEEISLEFNTNA